METITIFTDGSCNPNPGKGGWAFALSKTEFKSGSLENTTNNAMELTAILEAIAYTKYEYPISDIIVYSDSKYCVNGFNKWMHTWQRKGWKKKGGPIANLEIWKALWEVRDDVELRWVRGHDGNEMNEFVDVLASGDDPTADGYVAPERIKPEFVELFREYKRWTHGGYKNEDRDAFLRRLQSKYNIEKRLANV